MPPTVAREFFDAIINAPDPLAKIRSLINPSDPLFESDWLDFKGEHPTDPKQREKSNRICWSEYLTAFANTGGGVLIWGIDARRTNLNGRDIDFASSEAPINDPIALVSKLNEWQGQATNPPLSGVEIKPYALPEKPHAGFVVCYIPQGPLRPYQSLLTSDKQYYLRGGSSNFVMDRAVLSAMFYPRSKAVFRVRASLEHKASPRHTSGANFQRSVRNGVDRVACRVELFNDGTATAKEIRGYLTWGLPGEKELFQPIGGPSWMDGERKCAFYRSFPIHPGEDGSHVCSISWTVEHQVIDQDVKRGRMPGEPLEFIEFNIFCENQEPQTIKLEFDLRELVNEEKLLLEETVVE